MTNREAIGYMLLACKEAGVTDLELVRRLKREMYYQFDMKTESEADEQGHAWYVQLDES